MKKFVSEGNILIGPDPVFEPGDGGLGYELFTVLNENKGKLVQHILGTGETLSYDELLSRSIRIALYLSGKNMKKTDIICLCSGNSTNYLGILIGAKFADVGFAAIEPALPSNDIVYLINLLQPKILFVTETAIEKIEEALKKSNVEDKCELVLLGGQSSKYTTIYNLYLPVENENSYKPTFIRNLKETAIIFLSSGTSGVPKAVCTNHFALLSQIYILATQFHRKGTLRMNHIKEEFTTGGEHSIFHYSPPYWISSFLFTMVSIFCGGSTVVGTSFDAMSAWNILEKYQPDSVMLPPGQVTELCAFGASRQPIRKVSAFVTGGGFVTTSHMKDLEKCFPNTKVTQMYGQTENTGPMALFNVGKPEEMLYQKMHPNCCGHPANGSRMRVIDIETGKICGPGEKGELRVKNRYFMNGYFKMNSSSFFDSEGWFVTGDLVYFDENGYIYIVDRIKDLLLYTVYNIAPSVIENILRQHPAVFEGCVVGKPHLKDNEHPMGIVVLKQDYKETITEDEIVSFVNERVPDERYKLRAGIIFVKEMLKTNTGKLSKLEMKRRIREGIPL